MSLKFKEKTTVSYIQMFRASASFESKTDIVFVQFSSGKSFMRLY